MAITLRIDNVSQLSDGGPIEFSAGARGFDIGREQHMDWTLPDPNRVISGHHAQIRYENGTYWLHDVSRNGTMVNGSGGRVQSPYRLNNGDRLQIGHYFVSVMISGGAEQQPAPQPQYQGGYAPPPSGGDIWGVESSAAPMSRKQFAPPDQSRPRGPDVLQQYIDLPGPRGGQQPQYDQGYGTSIGAGQMRGMPGMGGGGYGAPMGAPAGATQWPGQAPPQPMMPQPQPMKPQPQPVMPQPMMPQPGGYAPAGGGAGAQGFIAAIAQAAGISPQALAQRDQNELAAEIGHIIGLTIEQLIALLRTRAVAKQMTKSSTRTMLGPANNNPLKFVPDAREAAEIMFSRSRPGYLTAAQAVKEAFENVKTHEGATFSAMQTALQRLTEQLNPDAIDEKAGGGLNKKSKAWELFVEQWEELSDSDNGILDAFLKLFAEAYDSASKG